MESLKHEKAKSGGWNPEARTAQDICEWQKAEVTEGSPKKDKIYEKFKWQELLQEKPLPETKTSPAYTCELLHANKENTKDVHRWYRAILRDPKAQSTKLTLSFRTYKATGFLRSCSPLRGTISTVCKYEQKQML